MKRVAHGKEIDRKTRRRLASRRPKVVVTSGAILADEQAIKGLPLNGRRFTELLLLMPGVTQDPRGQNNNGLADNFLSLD